MNNGARIKYFTIAESARSGGQRKIFQKMIDYARKFEIRDLIFKNTDRMSRNYHDLMTIEELYEQHDFNIHFYQTYRILNRQSTYADKFILNVEIAAARQLSDKLSHDIKESHRYKREKGIAHKAPIGYVFDKGKKQWIIDKKTETMVRWIFDEYDTGAYSLMDLVDLLNQKGFTTRTGKRWHKSRLHDMLISPFYHGEFVFRNQAYPGGQEKYYNKKRWEKRRAAMQQGHYTDQQMVNRPYALSRFLKCPRCGNMLYGDTKKGKYIYYVHKCIGSGRTGIYIPESEIMQQIDEHISSVRFNTHFAAILKKLFADAVAVKKEDARPQIGAVTRKINDLEAQQDKLTALYSRGTIPADILERNIRKLQGQIDHLYDERKKLSADKTSFTINAARIIDEMLMFPTVFVESDITEKITLLRDKAEYIEVFEDHVQIKWSPPYAFVMSAEILMHKDVVRERPGIHAKMDETRTPTALKKAVQNQADEWLLWLAA